MWLVHTTNMKLCFLTIFYGVYMANCGWQIFGPPISLSVSVWLLYEYLTTDKWQLRNLLSHSSFFIPIKTSAVGLLTTTHISKIYLEHFSHGGPHFSSCTHSISFIAIFRLRQWAHGRGEPCGHQHSQIWRQQCLDDQSSTHILLPVLPIYSVGIKGDILNLTWHVKTITRTDVDVFHLQPLSLPALLPRINKLRPTRQDFCAILVATSVLSIFLDIFFKSPKNATDDHKYSLLPSQISPAPEFLVLCIEFIYLEKTFLTFERAFLWGWFFH